MTDRPKARLALEPEDATDPEVGRRLAALTDTRKRTLETLKGLSDEALDRTDEAERNSIGTLLYHVALIEADWLLDDITGTQERDWPSDLFPVDHRDHDGVLSVLAGETLDQHLTRLAKVRDMLSAVLRPMTMEDLHTAREREHHHVTPAWVLHHLMQHEAEHRSQIAALRQRLGS